MERIDKVLGAAEEMLVKRQNDEITSREYADYLDEFYTIKSLETGFIKIIAHADYILAVHDETGIEPQFIFDAGYLRIFDSGVDIVCVAVLILLFSNIISNEYNSKYGSFANILRCAKNGRNKTFNTKFKVTVIISFIISVAYILIDFIFILKNYGLSNMDSVLLSIENFGGINTDMLLWQYMILFLTFKILGYIMLSCFILSLSGITKNNISTLIIISGFIFIPTLIRYLGVHFLDIIDINGILSIFKRIELADIFNINYFIYCIAFLMIYIIICVALMLKAKKIYVK
jgi:magnesium-transporting ATPase (P-type)